MAFNNDQNEPKLPTNKKERRNSTDLLPRYYRTNTNKKFLQATLDQLIQPGTVKKINGYVGRKNTKAVKNSDVYVEASDATRQNYQFEPSALVQDFLGNTTFYKDYIDHINHISVNDGIVSNHERINRQEFYSWNPHICWDKFTNYQQYYWLPFGPEPIKVLGNQLEITSTFTVKGVDEDDNVAYLFTPNGLTRNPTLRLFRGQTYRFEIAAPGHPFSIKKLRSAGTVDRYTDGVDVSAVEEGVLTFTVPQDAPNVLFYVSENSVDTGGVFHVLDIEENTAIDIETDLIGKKTFVVPNGEAETIALSNGMKVEFGGVVTPEKYASGFWYVEGVGSAIKLVAEKDLEIRSTYSTDESVLFDDVPFDQLPFSETGTYPVGKDYITINRASPDSNPWSRYNRWFHQDVIEVSARVNKSQTQLDQTARATRPIIEFLSGIKLYNFGHRAKQNVDVIDTFTQDVFSTIEGSLGYNIDGIDLVEGMRVLFTADTDITVKNRIYDVNFIQVTPPTRTLTFNATSDVNASLDTITFATKHGLTSRTRIVYTNEGNNNIPGLTNRQVYYVNVVDTFTIELYTRADLTQKVNILNAGTGLHQFETFTAPRRQIYLAPAEDTEPLEFETVSINKGLKNQGLTYWFNGTNWLAAQDKIALNQSPLFDIFDNHGNSFSDTSVYEGSSFAGNKIFSYKVGKGNNDSVLGFPLSYRNINNIGDILFDFNYLADPDFAYKDGNDLKHLNADTGYLKIIEDLDRISYENAWVKNKVRDVQPIVRTYSNFAEVPDAIDITIQEYISADRILYRYDTATKSWIVKGFAIDVYDSLPSDIELTLNVFVNGARLYKNEFTVEQRTNYRYVILTNSVTDELVALETSAAWPKNNNGYYKIPLNLENNPLNNNVQNFTLGEVINHVDSIVKYSVEFDGAFPGNSNLRDLGNVSAHGTRFVKHSSPLNFALYHLGDKNANLIKALDTARNEYGVFKRAFINKLSEIVLETDTVIMCSNVLQSLFENKPKSSPYYLSDMFAYTAFNKLDYTILDARTKFYPLTTKFNLENPSNKSVLIYLNGEQLVWSRDYQFGDDVFFELLCDINEGDLLEVYEYESTDGCFVPPTPSKLGLYPVYTPEIIVDNTYRPTPISFRVPNQVPEVTDTFRINRYNDVIQDYEILVYVDGITQSYGDDYEISKTPDDAIITFNTPVTKNSLVEIVVPDTMIKGHDGSTIFTFNDFRDQVILELEKRIFNNIKVRYNTDLFDIFNYVPGYSRKLDYSREEYNSIIAKYFYQWSLTTSKDYTKSLGFDRNDSFTFSYSNQASPDGTDIPGFWRGIYLWMLDTDQPHVRPWECLGYTLKPTWWEDTYGPAPYTSDNQILWNDIKTGTIKEPGKPVRTNLKFAKKILEQGPPVNEIGQLISPLDAGYTVGTLPLVEGSFQFGDCAPVEYAWRKSSYYPFALIQACLIMNPSDVMGRCFDRSRIVKNVVGQLVYQDTENAIRLEDILVPSVAEENTSDRIYTAGLINYVVDFLTSKNSARLTQYKSDLKSLTNKMSTRLGAYTNKEKYKILLDSKTPTASGGIFVPEENFNIALNTSSAVEKVVYSGVIVTKYSDGFEVRGYDTNNPYFTVYPARQIDGVITVGGISESYSLWEADKLYVAGKVVSYNRFYYRTKTTHTSTAVFNEDYFTRLAELPVIGGIEIVIKTNFNPNEAYQVSYGVRLPTIQAVVDLLQGYGAYLQNRGFKFDEFNSALGTVANWETSAKEFAFWSTQGWAEGSAITLSPASERIVFEKANVIAESLIDPFYGYNVYGVDGQKLDPEFIQVYRTENTFVIEPENVTSGIFGLVLYLVQKEHVATIDNATLFNDTIYDLEAGFHQERLKIVGYVSSNWNGGFEIPGFIYDEAKIQLWEPWTDYSLGDIVKYKEFYYAAKTRLIGTQTFEDASWTVLAEKPNSELLANWDYKAEQFTDFYDLDTDNLDAGQQKIAQHLIGYQKRQYLENIIQNDVSQYKFYQGMILEKGTQNVLNKLFDVLSAGDQESLTFDEEWAFRVGEYGAVDTYDEIELILDEAQFKIEPQPLELVDSIDRNVTDFVYRQRASDVYVKPKNYTNDIFPVTATTPFLRTPGYVRKDDVNVIVDKLSDVSALDVATFEVGHYVWCGFEGRDWNVYRFNNSGYNITNASFVTSTKIVTLTLNTAHNISVGDVIGIKGSEKLQGLHVVTEANGTTVKFVKDVVGWSAFTDADSIALFEFGTQRIASIDQANDIVPAFLKNNEIIWADSNGNNKWASYINNPVYRQGRISNLEPTANINFGTAISITDNGNLAAVADDNIIHIFRKATDSAFWALSDRIDETASHLKFSRDGRWLAASVPTALSGDGEIKLFVSQSNGEFDDVTPIAGVGAEQLGTNLAFAKRGATYYLAAVATGKVKIYRYNSPSWTLVQTITNAATEFGHDMSLNADGTYLTVSAPEDSSGKVFVYKFNGTIYTLLQTLDIEDLPIDEISDSEKFGESVTVSASGLYIAVGATDVDRLDKVDVGQVIVYKLGAAQFEYQQSIDSPRKNDKYEDGGERFGYHVEFMNDDTSLVIFALQGDIYQTASFDTYTQTIPNFPILDYDGNPSTSNYVNDPESPERAAPTVFDSASGGFRILDIVLDRGRIDVFDRLNENFIFGESLSNISTLQSDYGSVIAVGNSCILAAAKNEEDINTVNAGIVYSYVKPAGQRSWNSYYEQIDKPTVSEIKKVYIYNKVQNEIIAYLDVIDPTQGKIPGVADQEIKYKTYFDPAIYSLGIDSVTVDDGSNWTKTQVGQLWWDLTDARFLESQAGDVVYRSGNWNRLFDTASIDVYEWVESSLKPSQWDKIADTDKGIAQGVSGQSKYGDSVYSVSKRYDTISKTFKETYYFWVKNSIVIPRVEGRSLSSFDVAKLIADPAAYGYSCVALTGRNSISFINCKKYLEAKNVAINVQYWTSDSKESNYHSHWKLLSTNRNTSIPTAIETKWFHSLSGKDDNGLPVPNLDLPFKQRYGIEFRPRQSMFVNRIEALKQFIERANRVLVKKLIVDDYDISALHTYDPEPTAVSSLWDIAIDTDQELRFVATSYLRKATLSPVVEDGVITKVTITNSGEGYGRNRVYEVDINNDPVSWHGPSVTVTGDGINAKLKTIVNQLGQVISVIIENGGEGYLQASTNLVVRNYAVLVRSDSTSSSNWGIYTLDYGTKLWSKTRAQAFDVRRFWSYIDWYGTYIDPATNIETQYNQFTKIDVLVDNTYQLLTRDIAVGSIIKVKNIGSGGWVLLQKINNAPLYTEDNYTVIGRENGTIQFLDNLYTFETSNLGYDGQLFDSATFDGSPDAELAIILDTIKNNLFVDELKTEYLNLFFSSVRYALQEQIFVDWAFKTSFVKSQHNVGELKQKVTYNNDNLAFFEQYLNEVKPYRTKVREFVSNYNSLDQSRTFVTDFDLLPTVNENFQVKNKSIQLTPNGNIETNFGAISDAGFADQYILERLGLQLLEVRITDQGSGYVTPPVIKVENIHIQNQYDATESAQLKGYIANGRLNRIEIVNAGSNWARAPQITIEGGLQPNGTPAKAIAIMGGPLVRTNYVKVKFDRVTGAYAVTSLVENETFSGAIVSGARTQFELKWSPDIKFNNSYVTVNGVPMLRSDYRLSTVTATNRGFTSYSGLLTFTTAPEQGSIITIEYNKNFEHLTAADRINFFYDPQTGMIGKDTSQLMTGIDYGGVNITGVDFGINYGWSTQGWGSGGWDNYSENFVDYVAYYNGVSYEFRLPYVPEDNEAINIYISRFIPRIANYAALPVSPNTGDVYKLLDTEHVWEFNGTSWVDQGYYASNYWNAVRIDDPNFATINQTNDAAVMTTFTGDGEVDIIILPNTANLQDYTYDGNDYGDRIIFRKLTSDGAYPLSEDSYDTALSGGSFLGTSLISATGLAPDDIILDGDDFVSPTVGGGPEEFVPGYVLDALAIKVYHRPSSGCPNLLFKNHYGDGNKKAFEIGQYYPSDRSVIVKINDEVKDILSDYTIDHKNNTVVFYTAPNVNDHVDILSVNFSSSNVLDIDYFVADGATSEYITKGSWLPTVSAIVLVNGQLVDYSLFSTNEEYTELIGQTWRSRVGIRFGEPPAQGDIISYIIDAGNIEQNASVVRSENISYVTGQNTYTLTNSVGENKPYEQNVLVKTGQTILTPPSANYFTMQDNQVVYTLRDYKYDIYGVNASDVDVFIAGEQLNYGSDYTVSLNFAGTTYSLIESSISIVNRGTGYTVGDTLDAVGGDVGVSGSVASFQVVLVNPVTGAIQQLEYLSGGVYVTAPTNPITLIGGTGSGATLNASSQINSDPANITVTINYDKYVNEETIAIVVNSFADYVFNSSNQIEFTNTYANGTQFEVISFYNHNVLGVERTVDDLVLATTLTPGTIEYFELSDKLGGAFVLRSPVVSSSFVWVVKNGTLLTANIDYHLEADLVTVKLTDYVYENDVVQIIAFTNTVVHDSFGYMQFKDILNRVHYKRLNANKATLLAQDLNQNDKEIKVVDASVLDDPNAAKNVPGIIEINGERIEYFVKIGNVLSQLRRGTLGTGIPLYHAIDSVVQGIGPSETIPYNDSQIVKNYTVAEGDTGIIDLSYIPKINEIEVFVAGIRLKKTDYTIYSNVDYPYSPEGDIDYDAEFNISGLYQLQLNTADLANRGLFEPGQKVVVVKRQGKLWNDMGKRLAKSNNLVANFLKNTPTIWPYQQLDKYENRALTSSGNPLQTSSGDPLEF